jgi:hypothetical protein
MNALADVVRVFPGAVLLGQGGAVREWAGRAWGRLTRRRCSI